MARSIERSKLIDFAMGKLTPEESLRVIDILERDSEVSRELEVISGILKIAALEGEEAFKEVETRKWSMRKRMLNGFIDLADRLRERRIAYPLLGFSSAVVAVIGLILVSKLVTGRYYELTTIDRPVFEMPVRGQEEADFSKAQVLYRQGNYEESIRLMERYIRAYPDGDMIDYAYYSAGAMYIMSSQRSFLSLFPSFEHQRVLIGMENLHHAIASTKNARIAEDALWLRAKGFLMLDSPNEAVGELHRMESLNGMRRDSASQLVAKILLLEKGS